MAPSLPGAPDREIERTWTSWMEPTRGGNDFVDVIAVDETRSKEDSTHMNVDRDVAPVHGGYWHFQITREDLDCHCRLLLSDTHER